MTPSLAWPKNRPPSAACAPMSRTTKIPNGPTRISPAPRIFQKSGQLGRRPLPEDQRKQRVTLYLDRDVLARLKADGRGWQTRANAALRKALGL